MMGTANLTNENQMVELANGNIMMVARQVSGSHQWKAISTDGGQTWGDPMVGEYVVPVATGLERYTLESDGDDCNRIIWTGPAGYFNRLDVRVSYDEGETFPEKERLYNGAAVYSDLTILNDGTVGVFFERSWDDGIVFMRFTVVPEPTTIALLVCGGLMLVAWTFRRRRGPRAV
jgi:hypothetical protein